MRMIDVSSLLYFVLLYNLGEKKCLSVKVNIVLSLSPSLFTLLSPLNFYISQIKVKLQPIFKLYCL